MILTVPLFQINSVSQHVMQGNFVSRVMQCGICSIKCMYIKVL